MEKTLLKSLEIRDKYFQPNKRVEITLKKPIKISEKLNPVSDLVGIITNYKEEKRKYKEGLNIIEYLVITEFTYVDSIHLNKWNNVLIGDEKKSVETRIQYDNVEYIDFFVEPVFNN